MYNLIETQNEKSCKFVLNKFINFSNNFFKIVDNFWDFSDDTNLSRSKLVTLQMNSVEDIHIIKIMKVNNKNIEKILTTISAYCDELNFMKKTFDNDIFPILLQLRKKKITSLRNIVNLNHFIKEADNLLLQSLKQMNAIANILRKDLYIHLYQEWIEYFANILVTFICWDIILENEDIFVNINREFNDKLHTIKITNSLDQERNLKMIEKFFNDFQMNFSRMNFFKSRLDYCFKFIRIFFNNYTEDEIRFWIKTSLTYFEKNPIETILNKSQHLQLNVLVVFLYYLCGEIDPKILKRLFILNNKVCSYCILANFQWKPNDFLKKFIDITEEIPNNGCLFVNTDNFESLYIEVAQWIIKNNFIIHTDNDWKLLSKYKNSLISGFYLYKKIRNQILLFNHNFINTKCSKIDLNLIFRLLILITYLQDYIRNEFLTWKVLSYFYQITINEILKYINLLKEKLTNNKNTNISNVENLSILNAIQRCLSGPNTKTRSIFLKISMNLLHSVFKVTIPQCFNDIQLLMNHLETIECLHMIFNEKFDCSLLYCYESLLPIYISRNISTFNEFNNFQYLFKMLFEQINSNCIFVKNFNDNVDKYIRRLIFTQIKDNIELSLRTQSYVNPKRNSLLDVDYIPQQYIQRLEILSYDEIFYSLSHFLKYSLSNSYYNLITIKPKNYRYYIIMKNLANFYFNLEISNGYLPISTFSDYDFDIFHLLQNIDMLIIDYTYILSDESFVEMYNSNLTKKSINVIKSVYFIQIFQTHGLGLLSKMINDVYENFQNRLVQLFKYVFNEKVTLFILNELRSNNYKEKSNNYDFFETTKKNLLKLKANFNNNYHENYLDLLRKNITYLGNCLGLLRLIQIGFKKYIFYENMGLRMYPRTEKITINNEPMFCDLEFFYDYFTKQFSNDTNFMKLLAETLANIFDNVTDNHVDNFLLLIPILLMDFIDNMVSRKISFLKTNNSIFSNDGFIIGLIFIEKLLKQDHKCDYFEEFKSKLINNIRKIKTDETVANDIKDFNLMHTLSLRRHEFTKLLKEYQLLQYKYNNVKMFFL